MIKSVTWMARNHVAANLLMIFVMVAGISAYSFRYTRSLEEIT